MSRYLFLVLGRNYCYGRPSKTVFVPYQTGVMHHRGRYIIAQFESSRDDVFGSADVIKCRQQSDRRLDWKRCSNQNIPPSESARCYRRPVKPKRHLVQLDSGGPPRDRLQVPDPQSGVLFSAPLRRDVSRSSRPSWWYFWKYMLDYPKLQASAVQARAADHVVVIGYYCPI